MKKILLAAVAIMMFCGGSLRAQDCQAVLLPMVNFNAKHLAEYPAEKAAWYCNFSHNAFFFAESVPEGARVFSITELTDVNTGNHPAADIVIDLNTFSFYAYDFTNFQHLDYHRTIYFETSNTTHKFLAVRAWDEIYDRTEHPERYK